MKIEDMQTLPEFFGVEMGFPIWIGCEKYFVQKCNLCSLTADRRRDSQALVGCLTGQLKWSKHEPMTAEEENILRELAAWFPSWQTLRLEKDGDIGLFTDYGYCNYYFGFAEESSRAYEVLAPILEKHGEINLEDYR